MKPFDEEHRKLTIVQVAPDYYSVPPPAYGGIERMVHTLTEQLVRLGHRVILFAREGSVTRAELIPYHHIPGHPESIRDTVIRLLPEGVDVIHDHTHTSVIGRERLPVPTLCTVHATVDNGVEHPVYGSHSSRNHAGVNEGEFVFHGINPNEYEYAAAKQQFLLFMGVISPHKGVQHALRIAEETGQRLILAGPIFSSEYFRTDIEPVLKRNPHIEYVGEVGGDRKKELLRDASCMLFPTCCEEAFGLVMIEALISGTPVLALDNGAVPEVLSGFPELVCRTVDEMKDKLLAGQFPGAEALRNYVLDRFSHEKMARQYLGLYFRLCDSHVIQHAGISRWKELEREDLAVQACDAIIDSEKVSLGDRLHACNEAAEIWRLRRNEEQEKRYVFRSFEMAPPRAEFCCRLGYLYMQLEEYARASYWYRLATQIERPEDRSFYIESCWTWLPYIQLCVCSYRLGDPEAAYRYNEQARKYVPEDQLVEHNKTFLESLLHISSGITSSVDRFEKELTGPNGSLFRMSLSLPGFIEETIRDQGAWEPGLAKLLIRFLQPGRLFVDVGANIGYHTLFIASSNEQIQCIAYEPNPEIFSSLDENVKLNGFMNIKAICQAIGDSEGKTEFYMQRETAYNRGLSGASLGPGVDPEEFVACRIPVIPLDEALYLNPMEVGVLKIDTQGYEYEVLRGAQNIITRSKPVIAFEFHTYGTHRLEDIFPLLPGYRFYKLQAWTGEWRPATESDPPGFEGDYICIPDGMEL